MSDNPDLNPAVAPEPEPGRGAVPGSGPESAPDFLPPPPDPGISEIGPPDEVASNRPGPTPTGRVVDAMAKWLPKFARRVHQVVLAMSWLAGLTGTGALLIGLWAWHSPMAEAALPLIFTLPAVVAPAIAARRIRFRIELVRVLARLGWRMMKENRELYPMADAELAGLT